MDVEFFDLLRQIVLRNDDVCVHHVPFGFLQAAALRFLLLAPNRLDDPLASPSNTVSIELVQMFDIRFTVVAIVGNDIVVIVALADAFAAVGFALLFVVRSSFVAASGVQAGVRVRATALVEFIAIFSPAL